MARWWLLTRIDAPRLETASTVVAGSAASAAYSAARSQVPAELAAAGDIGAPSARAAAFAAALQATFSDSSHASTIFSVVPFAGAAWVARRQSPTQAASGIAAKRIDNIAPRTCPRLNTAATPRKAAMVS